jgi:rRNA-processing protein FCF1
LVKVICDTNFLIHLATKRIKNFDKIICDLGSIQFLVPNVAYHELKKLQTNSNKKNDIKITLEYIKKFERIQIDGTYADEEILKFVENNHSFIGTMDKELKKKVKAFGSSIISFHNDNLILEI